MGEKKTLNKGGIVLHIGLIAALLIAVGLILLRVYSWDRQGDSPRVLALVNPWNPVSETGYSVRLTWTEGGCQVDRSCAEALQVMLGDCRSAGRKPVLAGAYRSVDDQLVLYDGEVQRLVETGMMPEEAENTVARIIARPGRSEHELGLAVDIVDEDYPVEDETQATTQTTQWLEENAWKYGFIVRYPRDAEEITGYSWHPWHYRYVGMDAAENIHSLGVTLEEYLSLFYSEEAAVEVSEGN